MKVFDCCGVEQRPAHQVHTLGPEGSSPSPATKVLYASPFRGARKVRALMVIKEQRGPGKAGSVVVPPPLKGLVQIKIVVASWDGTPGGQASVRGPHGVSGNTPSQEAATRNEVRAVKKQTCFRPGQRYTRRTGEVGIVREVVAGRVIMDVTSGAKRISGVETFYPTHSLGWSLCM